MISPEMKHICIEAIDGALVSRGTRKGMLKASCPKMDTDAAAAWQAMMLHANPYKVSMWQLSAFSERQLAIYNRISDSLEGKDLRSLDRDRVVLETIGVW